jgi:hypothetical protein
MSGARNQFSLSRAASGNGRRRKSNFLSIDFQKDGKRPAKDLSLSATSEAFFLSERKLQREYFDRFEAICNELKKAEPGAASNGGPAGPFGNSGVTEGRGR